MLSFAADPAGGYKGAMDKVEDLMKIMPNYHCFNQATNLANPEAHFKWTGIYLFIHGNRHYNVSEIINVFLSSIVYRGGASFSSSENVRT